jgi:cyclase
LFNGGTPIVWSGPISNWLQACATIQSLSPAVVVPGHGPVTDLIAVAAMAGYFEWLLGETATRQEAGMTAIDSAWDLDLGPYEAWTDSERTVVNVDAAYAERDPSHQRMNALNGMQEMGRYRTAHR